MYTKCLTEKLDLKFQDSSVRVCLVILGFHVDIFDYGCFKYQALRHSKVIAPDKHLLK